MKADTFDQRTRDLGWSVEEIAVMIKQGFLATRTGSVIRIRERPDDVNAASVRMSPSAETARLWTGEFNRRSRKGRRS